MANFIQATKDLKLMQWEGGYVNNPNDSGGATNHGVTLATWRSFGYDKNNDGKIDEEDIKLLTTNDAFNVAKKIYWNPFKLDEIQEQQLANLIFQIAWGSGNGRAAQAIKTVINKNYFSNMPVDKSYDANTHQLLKQKINQSEFYEKLRKWYVDFLLSISQPGSKNAIFRKGWINRMNDVLPEIIKKK